MTACCLKQNKNTITAVEFTEGDGSCCPETVAKVGRHKTALWEWEIHISGQFKLQTVSLIPDCSLISPCPRVCWQALELAGDPEP